MLLLIKDNKTLKEILEKLTDKLSKVVSPPYGVKYRTKNHRIDIEVNQTSKGFWWSSTYILDEDKYLNPFGIGIYEDGDIGVFELNISNKLHETYLPSQFSKDEQGFVLLHSGAFGGGVAGRDKSAFKAYCNGRLDIVDVFPNKEYFVISYLEDDKLFDNILYFIELVYNFKKDFKTER